MNNNRTAIGVALLIALGTLFTSADVKARRGKSLSLKALEESSTCVVRGTVKKISDVLVDGKPTYPEKLKVVSIEITKMLKSSGVSCASIEPRVDILVAGGPTEGARSELCDVPMVGGAKDFYLDTQRYVIVPANCYDWFR